MKTFYQSSGKIVQAVFFSVGHLRVLLPLYMVFPPVFTGNPGDVHPMTNFGKPSPATFTNRLASFFPVEGHAQYFISICADIPNDKDPDRVVYRKEPGHVFVILEKKDSLGSPQTITQVFGFYPRRPASSLVFKNVRCRILDNGSRQYNAALVKQLTAAEFLIILENAQALAGRKYNINKFNCYDYALRLFNSLPGIDTIPVRHIKFPFIFGRGGSPCALYRDLEKLRRDSSVWAPHIRIGTFVAPASYAK